MTTQHKPKDAPAMKPGDAIKYDDPSSLMCQYATVVKVNRKTVTVKDDDGFESKVVKSNIVSVN
jgi:hypothetical protein